MIKRRPKPKFNPSKQISLKILEAAFIVYEKAIAGKGHGRKLPDGSMQWGGFEVDVQRTVDNLKDAHGIRFLCPLCYENNGGPVGTHSVCISFAGRAIPKGMGSINSKGKEVRWSVSGTGLNDLRLSPSILLEIGCRWHGYIGNNGAEPGYAK